jgi:hypothetical protein
MATALRRSRRELATVRAETLRPVPRRVTAIPLVQAIPQPIPSRTGFWRPRFQLAYARVRPVSPVIGMADEDEDAIEREGNDRCSQKQHGEAITPPTRIPAPSTTRHQDSYWPERRDRDNGGVWCHVP